MQPLLLNISIDSMYFLLSLLFILYILVLFSFLSYIVVSRSKRNVGVMIECSVTCMFLERSGTTIEHIIAVLMFA